MRLWRAALLIALLALSACARRKVEEPPPDPPVLPTVTGLILRAGAVELVSVAGNAITGELTTYIDEETPQITLRFLNDQGQEFTPVSGFSLATAVASGAVASVVGASGWTFRVQGEGEGATTLTLSVLQSGETRYSSPAIPISVERRLGSLHWLAPDTLRTIVTGGPVAIGVAPFAGTAFARVDFGVNGAPLSSDTSAPFTATWDPTRFAAPGIYGLEAMGFDGEGTPLAADTLFLMVPAMTGDLSGRYGGQGDDRVYAMVGLLSDAVGLIGETTMPGGNIQGCVMKLSPGSEERWYRNYGGSGSDHLRSGQGLADGSFIVCGWTYSLPGTRGPNAWVLRLNEGGGVIWSRILGDADDTQYAHCVRRTSDGGFIVAGERQSGGVSRLVLHKLDATGAVTWSQEHGGPGRSIGYAVEQTVDGGTIVTGLREVSGQERLWMLKTTSSGAEDWSRDYLLGSPFNAGRALTLRTGGYAVVGGGDKQLWFLGLDVAGDEDWNVDFGDAGWDQGLALTAMPAGGYLLGGYIEVGGPDDRELFLVRTSGAGVETWRKTYGGVGQDEARALMPWQGGSLIAGVTDEGSAGGADIWLFTLDANGDPAD